MKTTPDPEFDIREQLPYLDDLARITIRLHPRRAANLPPQSSKMGWPFLWPEDEPWPVCNATMPAKHMRAYEESLRKVSEPDKFLDIASSFESLSKEELQSIEDSVRETTAQVIRQGREGHKMHYHPVLQLRRDEFPDLPFPTGSDLFQLLWCPLIHWLDEGPGHLIYWRHESEILRPRTEPVPFDDGSTLYSCSLDQEPLTDLPAVFDAGDRCMADVERIFSEEENGWLKYESEFGPAPGTKLFGLPSWIQGPDYPQCSKCRRALKLLVTIASYEFGHGQQPLRWVPREEQAQAAALQERRRSSDDDERRAALTQWEELDRSHGLMIGDGGNAYLFYCPQCPSQPIVGTAECS